MNFTNLKSICIFAGLMIIIIACKPATHHQTLSLFFDGVPTQEYETKSTADSSANQKKLLKTPLETKETVQIGQARSMHGDYRQKFCEKCHNINHSYRLIQRQPDLCYTCHPRFEEKHTHIHGPVAAGFCTACHLPHKSEYAALLKMPVREVCQHCHEPGDLNKNEAHKKASDIACLQCHDPHGGNTLNLLKVKTQSE